MNTIDFTLNKTNLYEQIADALEQAILKPGMQEESKLPSEQALGRQFKVSRTVIREALKLLKERGLIVQRTGDGSYVSRPNANTVSNAIGRIVTSDSISNDDLHVMRIILEVASVRLASTSITAAELAHLRAIIKTMEDRTLSVSQRVALDSSFHIALAEASRNGLLKMFVQTMTDLLKDYMAKGVILPGGIEDGLQRHGYIIDALATAQPDVAEQAMREHLAASRENVRKFEVTCSPAESTDR